MLGREYRQANREEEDEEEERKREREIDSTCGSFKNAVADRPSLPLSLSMTRPHLLEMSWSSSEIVAPTLDWRRRVYLSRPSG